MKNLTIIAFLFFISGCSAPIHTSNIDEQVSITVPPQTTLPMNEVNEQVDLSTSAATTTPTTSIEPTSPEANDRVSIALQALGAVLLNKAELCTGSNKNIYLNSLTYADFGLDYDEILPPIQGFAVVDMDGEGIPEVVLEFTSRSGFLVLHYTDNKVYGYYLAYERITAIQKDGSIIDTGGSATASLQKMRFRGTTWDFDEQVFSNIDSDGAVAYMHDVPILRKLYYDRLNALQSDVAWHLLTEETITKLVIERPTSLDVEPTLPMKNLIDRQRYLDDLSGLISLVATKSSNGSTEEEYAEAKKYYKDWDYELNKIYQLLSAKMSATDMEKLREEQQLWIGLRDQKGEKTYLMWTTPRYNGDVIDYKLAEAFQNYAIGQVTKRRTYYLIDLYFGVDWQMPLNTIINQYSLDETLRLASEDVIFAFKIEDSDKYASVCVAKNKSYIVFRLGTNRLVDIQYPYNEIDSWDKFVNSNDSGSVGKIIWNRIYTI